MPYTPPTYNAIAFTWNSDGSYTPPAYSAVNFVFTDEGVQAAISGIGTADFLAYYELQPVNGFAVASFSASWYGYQAGEINAAGYSVVDIKVIAYQSGDFTIATPASVFSISQEVFSAGTYSLIAPYLQPSFYSVTFGGGLVSSVSAAIAAFDPYYAMSCLASSATSIKVGAIVTNPASFASYAGSTLLSESLRQGFIDCRGHTLQAIHIAPIRQASISTYGSGTLNFPASMVFDIPVSIHGTSASAVTFCGLSNSEGSSYGAAYSAIYSSSYAVVSTAIYANGELLLYVGGVVTHPFSGIGSSSVSGGLEKLLHGHSSILGNAVVSDCTIESRIQALRYETSYVFTSDMETSVLVVNEDLAAITRNEETYPMIDVADIIAFHNGKDPIFVVKNL